MNAQSRRKTSLTLDAAALDEARQFGVNVSAVADAALKAANREARNRQWREENAEAFAGQAAWHEKHGHPLAEIMAGPIGDLWRD